MDSSTRFTVRITVPEGTLNELLAEPLRGWGQVTSFGSVQFSKRTSAEEALRALAALNCLGVEYSLSIHEAGKGSIEKSWSVLVASVERGADFRRSRNMPPLHRNARRPPRKAGDPAAGSSLGIRSMTVVFGLLFLVGFVVTEIVGKKSPVLSQTCCGGFCEDAFLDNRYGWIQNESAAIESGKYVVHNQGSDKAALIANERLFGQNGMAEAQVSGPEGNEDSFAGLAFRIRNSENFYMFGISPNGSVAIVKRELGFWNRLLPGGGILRSRAEVHPDTEHHLRIVAKGVYIEFYLDDELLTVVRDESFEEGSLGFYVGKNLQAAFDDLLLAFYEHDSVAPAERPGSKRLPEGLYQP